MRRCEHLIPIASIHEQIFNGLLLCYHTLDALECTLETTMFKGKGWEKHVSSIFQPLWGLFSIGFKEAMKFPKDGVNLNKVIKAFYKLLNN